MYCQAITFRAWGGYGEYHCYKFTIARLFMVFHLKLALVELLTRNNAGAQYCSLLKDKPGRRQDLRYLKGEC
jgi:hypothetical protein